MDDIAIEKMRKKRTVLFAVIIIILIPMTIIAGYRNLAKGKYIIISLLIIAYIMLPFLLVFEKKKPQAREMVVISVMSALTVVMPIHENE
ncbi:MAG: hypothetical protein ACOWWR_18000 [Eubacteriales bacterium]